MTVEPDPARSIAAIALVRPDVVLLDLTDPRAWRAGDLGAALYLDVAQAAHPAPVICLVGAEPRPPMGSVPPSGLDRGGGERELDHGATGPAAHPVAFAEHWIRRPFSPRLLVATVAEALRRDSAAEDRPDVLRAGSVLLDPQDRSVLVGERSVALTATEFDLLAFLMRGPGRVYTREQLLEAVWGPATSAGARTVDVHVAQLRAKLGPASPLRTVRGVGYAVDE